MTILTDQHIEIIKDKKKRGQIRFAIFDFDGTISTFREGWQDVMHTLMVEHLRDTPQAEAEDALAVIAREAIDSSTGIQTIYQMIALREMVLARGGDAREAVEYKAIFSERLMARIEHRLEAVRSGEVDATELMVPGAINILEGLKTRGVRCFLASGTDQNYVKIEAGILGVSGYFEEIYGALENFQSYSKRMVIERIISENHLHGSELVGFGDGFVEIEDVNRAGGIAVGVASDELTRSGVNQWKRERLIAAGADVIIPDFQSSCALIDWLWNESK